MSMEAEPVIGVSLPTGKMASFLSKRVALGPIVLPMAKLVDIHVRKYLAVPFERLT
jgi:hypothetical protein